jgi:hypothetical protein
MVQSQLLKCTQSIGVAIEDVIESHSMSSAGDDRFLPPRFVTPVFPDVASRPNR